MNVRSYFAYLVLSHCESSSTNKNWLQVSTVTVEETHDEISSGNLWSFQYIVYIPFVENIC